MKLCSLCIALFFIVASAGHSAAAEAEHRVKAAMLYNFAKFVDWPAASSGSDTQIIFCIAGKSRLNAPLLDMQGKQIKGRSLVVREIDRPGEVSECQVLFISASEKSRASSYLQQSANYAILTVSELEKFVDSGGMIGFIEEDNKIRFEINLDVAKKQGLKISSHLLNLGKRVLK